MLRTLFYFFSATVAVSAVVVSYVIWDSTRGTLQSQPENESETVLWQDLPPRETFSTLVPTDILQPARETVAVERFGETVVAARDEILIVLEPGVTRGQIRGIEKKFSDLGVDKSALSLGYLEDVRTAQIDLPPGLDIAAIADEFASVPGVAAAGLNEVVETDLFSATQDRVLYGIYDGVVADDADRNDDLYWRDHIRLDAALRLAARTTDQVRQVYGSPESVIGVVDTGLKLGGGHPDLIASNRVTAFNNVREAVRLLIDNPVADESFTMPPISSDRLEAEASELDELARRYGNVISPHGRWVAAFVAANRDPAEGVDPWSKLVAVNVESFTKGYDPEIQQPDVETRIFRSVVISRTAQMLRGQGQASSTNGRQVDVPQAQVVNISLGGVSNCDAEPQDRRRRREEWRRFLSPLADLAYEHDATLVLSAGNDCEKSDDLVLGRGDLATNDQWTWRAATLNVTASTPDKRIWCRGRSGFAVDVAAPGVGVNFQRAEMENLSSIYKFPFEGTVFEGTGTSFSAPMVSGVIGLMRNVSPELLSEEVVSIIRNTSGRRLEDECPLTDDTSRAAPSIGLLNAEAAVEEAARLGLVRAARRQWADANNEPERIVEPTVSLRGARSEELRLKVRGAPDRLEPRPVDLIIVVDEAPTMIADIAYFRGPMRGSPSLSADWSAIGRDLPDDVRVGLIGITRQADERDCSRPEFRVIHDLGDRGDWRREAYRYRAPLNSIEPCTDYTAEALRRLAGSLENLPFRSGTRRLVAFVTDRPVLTQDVDTSIRERSLQELGNAFVDQGASVIAVQVAGNGEFDPRTVSADLRTLAATTDGEFFDMPLEDADQAFSASDRLGGFLAERAIAAQFETDLVLAPAFRSEWVGQGSQYRRLGISEGEAAEFDLTINAPDGLPAGLETVPLSFRIIDDRGGLIDAPIVRVRL